MATTAQNNIVKSVAPKSVFPDASQLITSAINYNQGDLLYLDTTNHLIKALDSDAHAANLLGVAMDTVVKGIIQRPYTTAVDGSAAAGAIQGPVYGVVASFTIHTGDAVNPGDLVYAGADAQTVTTASGNSHAVGVYQGATIASAAAGTKINCLVGSQYPGGALVF